MSGRQWRMTKKLGGSNLSRTNFKVLSQNLTVNTEENHEKPVMIVGNPNEIRTECVPNAKQNNYLLNLLNSILFSMALQLSVGPWPLFQILNLIHSRMTPWTRDQPAARPQPTHRTTEIQNKRTQTSMPRVEFEPMTPVFEQAKTVHALDRAATVMLHIR
jgi:hypothetical protein